LHPQPAGGFFAVDCVFHPPNFSPRSDLRWRFSNFDHFSGAVLSLESFNLKQLAKEIVAGSGNHGKASKTYFLTGRWSPNISQANGFVNRKLIWNTNLNREEAAARGRRENHP